MHLFCESACFRCTKSILLMLCNAGRVQMHRVAVKGAAAVDACKAVGRAAAVCVLLHL